MKLEEGVKGQTEDEVIRHFLKTLIDNCAFHHSTGCACLNACQMNHICFNPFGSLDNIEPILKTYHQVVDQDIQNRAIIQKIKDKGVTLEQIEQALNHITDSSKEEDDRRD